MGQYKLTKLAVQDLSDIWNYTFDNWSEQMADSYHDLLIKAFESLASSSDHGRNYDGIQKDLYGFRVNRHVIFYRIISNELLEITRILHERMDLKNQLK